MHFYTHYIVNKERSHMTMPAILVPNSIVVHIPVFLSIVKSATSGLKVRPPPVCFLSFKMALPTFYIIFLFSLTTKICVAKPGLLDDFILDDECQGIPESDSDTCFIG